ncbi:hypothetical protein F5Y13DRAFT_153940 [Hypoxylon sp. FL1857]|nr:hypothetical protein F5Y13DRAFT_153940 [Hypoxylon sp. FL1857]
MENIPMLPDGKLFLATLNSPELRIIDPEVAQPTAKTVATMPDITGLASVTPTNHGLFAVSGGDHASFSFTEGSMMEVSVVSIEANPWGTSPLRGVVVGTIPVANTRMLNGNGYTIVQTTRNIQPQFH